MRREPRRNSFRSDANGGSRPCKTFGGNQPGRIRRADNGGLKCLASLLNLDPELVARHARLVTSGKHTIFFTVKESELIWNSICRDRADVPMVARPKELFAKMGWGQEDVAAWLR